MSANQTNGAATRTNAPDGEKFTEGERAIMLRITHLETDVDRLAVKVGALIGTFERLAIKAISERGKKGGAQ